MAADPLTEFNELPATAARDALLACCAAPSWAERMLTGRPYCSARDAVRQSEAIVVSLTDADLGQALAGHPRIGERPAADQAGGPTAAQWSRQEQSRVSTADAQTARELAAANREYEQRFGHIYLVCASGRTAAQLLALLRARLANDDEREWAVVRSELQKITEIRLLRLLAGAP
ncbi:MAG TPA: 2-oxo-4-hydroxy-4-carboxy-5-ureidoimidazoline decarboxylase [Streptosporangiaceae bacterium]|nr:2-oxo-4-hydroxy-4-carboxy-5-ureidoimidazoline decarboxylase [Streptosporangiaceae bacterium]